MTTSQRPKGYDTVWVAMVIENLPLVQALVILLLLMIFLQTVFVGLLFYHLSKRSEQLNRYFEQRSQQLIAAMTWSRNTLHRMSKFGENLPAVQRELDRTVTTVSRILHRGDEKAARGLEAARESIRKGGRQVEGTLSRFTRQTSRVQRLVRTPALHVSALLKGGFVAIQQYLKERKAESPASHVPDKEIFI